jgi:transcriptional regulator with XRE-family HTH domain
MSTRLVHRENPMPTGSDLLAGLAHRLRDERQRLGLSQSAFAELLGITTRAVQHYEAGASTIRLDILYRMLDAGVDVHFLLFGDLNSVPFNAEVWERVNQWADGACRDRKGRPFPEEVRHQRVHRVYRFIMLGRTAQEVQERLEQSLKVA